MGTLKRGEDPISLLDYNERNEALTKEAIQNASQRFFSQLAGELSLKQYPLSAKSE